MVVVGSRWFRQARVALRWPRLVRAVAAAVAVFGSGCAGDPSIHLQLVVPGGETTLAGAASVELTAARHDRRIAFETVPYSSGAALSLTHVGFGDDLTISVTARDADASPLAYGVIGPNVTAKIGGGDCCLSMCVCSLALFDSGGCTCGSTACEAKCGGQ